MCIRDSFDAALNGYVPVSSFTGKTETGKWMQCSVSLSSVVADATYQDFLNRNSTHIGVYATNPGSSQATIEEMCIRDSANGAQPTEENYRVQNGFNQVFVNTVRATGGRNQDVYKRQVHSM